MKGYPFVTVGSVLAILQCSTTPTFSVFFFWIPFRNPMLRPDTAGVFQVNSLISKKKEDSETSKFLLGSIFKYPNDAEQKKIALLFHPNEPSFQCCPDSYPCLWNWEHSSILTSEYTLEGCTRRGEWTLLVLWAGQAEATHHEKKQQLCCHDTCPWACKTNCSTRHSR